MKRTPLKRKTPLRAKTGLKQTRRKRKEKTPLQKAKEELWQLCRQITFAVHGKTCYTCGAQNLEGSNCQCGHFITKSTCSAELAHCLKNLRPQCFRCNINLSGNWLVFERNLTADHGIEYVQELKVRNERTKGRKYDLLWYQEKIKEYKEILESL